MKHSRMVWENDRDERRGTGDAGLGLTMLVVGAALGATAALLLGPKAGQQLRARVGDVTGDWKANAAEALAQGRERVIGAVEQAQRGTGEGHPAGTDARSVKPVSRA